MVELLQQVDAPLAGTVLNDVQHGGGYDYGYGDYGYSQRPAGDGASAASGEESANLRTGRKVGKEIDAEASARSSPPAPPEVDDSIAKAGDDRVDADSAESPADEMLPARSGASSTS